VGDGKGGAEDVSGKAHSRMPAFGVRVRARRPDRKAMSETRPPHPRDPLTADEVARVEPRSQHDGLGPPGRVILVALAEPPRAAVSGPGAVRYGAEYPLSSQSVTGCRWRCRGARMRRMPPHRPSPRPSPWKGVGAEDP